MYLGEASNFLFIISRHDTTLHRPQAHATISYRSNKARAGKLDLLCVN